MTTIYQAHKNHNIKYNIVNVFLFKAVDATQQFIISYARIFFEKYQTIVLRFKKRNSRTIMNIFFKFIDFKLNANDLEFFFEVVKQTIDKLTIINVDSIIIVNAFCQDIIYYYLISIHNFFVDFVFQQQNV